MQYNVIVHSYIQRKVRKQGAAKGLMARLARPGSVWVFILLAGCYALLYQILFGNGLEEFGFGIVDFSLRYDSIPELGIGGMSFQAGYDLFAATMIYSVGILHYYFDSFIWKVRDTRIQEGL